MSTEAPIDPPLCRKFDATTDWLNELEQKLQAHIDDLDRDPRQVTCDEVLAEHLGQEMTDGPDGPYPVDLAAVEFTLRINVKEGETKEVARRIEQVAWFVRDMRLYR